MIEFTAAWAARLVRDFDASGVHRASTPGDFASGEWLSAEARRTGAEPSHMPVEIPRTLVDEAYVECDGQRFDGLPMFDSPPVSEVRGTLCACGQDGEIGYLELPPNSASIKGMRFEDIRRKSKHAALLVATRVAGESLAPINAQFFDAPFGPPVLQVAGMHHAFLADRALKNTKVTFVSQYRREPARSYNVVARVAAASSGSPIVLLTPRTGWWESTAERAGGLVAWLAGVAAAADLRERAKLRRSVHAFATCGHELGHQGLNALLAQESNLVRESECWLHLGANLGCASNQTLMLRTSMPSDSDHMRDLLLSEGYAAESIRIEPISAVSGEGRDIVDHGGKVLSMAGSNLHFHAASDRWPGNVSAANIAAIARAVDRWLSERAA